jgi:hypothetical protein
VLPIRQHLLGLVIDSRNTDLGLGLLEISDHNDKLKTPVKIFNLLVGLAEYSAISMEGVKFNFWNLSIVLLHYYIFILKTTVPLKRSFNAICIFFPIICYGLK